MSEVSKDNFPFHFLVFSYARRISIEEENPKSLYPSQSSFKDRSEFVWHLAVSGGFETWYLKYDRHGHAQ